jgi:DNA-binding transcriptional MerR regulator
MTQQQVADVAGITTKTLRAWRADGLDISNVGAVIARARSMAARIVTAADEGDASLREQIQKAELRRKLAQADRLEMEAEKVRGTLIDATTLNADFEMIGRMFRQAHDKAENDLPPMLAGRPAGEIKKILHRVFREMLEELSHGDAHRHIQDLINSAP